jgi:AraC-like DNA-binding protein
VPNEHADDGTVAGVDRHDGPGAPEFLLRGLLSQGLAPVREDLVHTDMTIATIAHRWSYQDPSHLGWDFRRHVGVWPSEYGESHGC